MLAPLVVDSFVPGVLSDSEVVFSDFSCWRVHCSLHLQ